MDRWSVYKKCDDFRVQAPKSIYDVIEIVSIAENGIFEVGKGGIFTKTYKFSDINFVTASVDEQEIILENWCRWLNSNSVPFKITFNNKNKNMATLREEVLFAKKMDEYDVYRDMFNEAIEDRIVNGRQGIEQELYVTIRYDNSPSYENAKSFFGTLENNMIQAYRQIGSELKPLDATERLRILHDFYRFGKEEYFHFDFRNAVSQGFDFKEAIANSKLDFSNEKYFKSDDVYCAAIYLKQFQCGKLSDRFLTSLSNLPIKMMCSLDCVPISDKDVDDMLKSLYLGIQNRVRKQNRTRVKQYDFNTDISLNVKIENDDIEQMIREKKEEDQHFFYSMMNIIVISPSLEKLQKDVDLIRITANSSSIIFDYSYMKQREALNTVLPVGVRQVKNGRNLQTKSLASLFPFNVQELFMPGGCWYGNNMVSKNLCMANRKKLMNPHGFYFGVTGSGKTTACELEVMQIFCNTEDDIIIVDPKNDYEHLCELLKGGYLNVSTHSDCRFNPLAYYDALGDSRKDVADEKLELVLSICETCKREPLTAKERSIVGRALKSVYSESVLKGEFPTFTDLYNAFDKVPEAEGKDLKLYMELFVTGSMNIFSEQSNVNIYQNRFSVFGLRDMGKELRDLSMLVMLECIKERIMWNSAFGKSTWLFIDEFHEVLHTDYSQSYIKSLWMLVRSLGGICTGLTQNVTDVLINYTTRAMLDNSEFMMILKQRDGATSHLIEDVGLSPEITKYCTKESESGKGIIRAGSITVPCSIEIKKETALYDLLINKKG